MNNHLLHLLTNQDRPFVYVDCGARNEKEHPLVKILPNARYIGFEPDAEECTHLQQQAAEGHTFLPVALGEKDGFRTIYLTRNPACSSFLKPDRAFFSRFLDCAPQIEITGTERVRSTSLDAYLPEVGVTSVDFIELDTQGTELEILRGSKRLLSTSVLGIQAEVEFSPIYQGQPLFADVDDFLRSLGFMLFDFSRHYYRRQDSPRSLKTRGQLLFGHAIYLKDYFLLPQKVKWECGIRLSVLADFLGFRDYAYEIIKNMQADPAFQKKEKTSNFSSVLKEYDTSIGKPGIIYRLARLAERLRVKKWLDRAVLSCEHAVDQYASEKKASRSCWRD